MKDIELITKELESLADPVKVPIYMRFFKTGKGQYGEGDQFIGVTVPNTRKVVSKFWKTTDLAVIQELLKSKVHEVRLLALGMLVTKFKKGDEKLQNQIFNLYLKNTKYINNWDLVDTSAPQIVGSYLLTRDRSILYEMTYENDLWRQRIAIMGTFAFIKAGQIDDTLKISKLLLNHPHDLIHKAVGWMLREAGKVDESRLLKFIKVNYSAMPRTMLRYAIEKFPESKRKAILKGQF